MSEMATKEPGRNKCACCGLPLSTTDDLCATCLSELNSHEPETDSGVVQCEDQPVHVVVAPPPIPQLIHLHELPGALNDGAVFPQVDWDVVEAHIQKHIEETDGEKAWAEALRQWLWELRNSLGGSYQVRESSRFLVLSDMPHEDANRLLAFVEHAADIIEEQLGEAAAQFRGFKLPLLVFGDVDDYYAYVFEFYPDGSHAASGGMCISKGYVHIAAPLADMKFARPVLAHELVHTRLNHLPIPTWLNEGLAVTLEKAIVGGQPPILDEELAERHHRFWNPENIQSFWAGTSVDIPGDSQFLTYSLAEILIQLLARDRPRFISFVRTADELDAGQTAALDCLEVDLGDAASEFLGPGDWRPNRKAILECWKAAGWTGEPDTASPEKQS